MNPTDKFDLKRFVDAQASVYASAISELRSGQKRGHWMWFIFPQVNGLAVSATSRYYAIKSVGEAFGYLEHPILGARLIECSQTLVGLEGRSASRIFGYPDDLKLRSSMTLFFLVDNADPVFGSVLDKYFDDERDERTVEIVGRIGT